MKEKRGLSRGQASRGGLALGIIALVIIAALFTSAVASERSRAGASLRAASPAAVLNKDDSAGLGDRGQAAQAPSDVEQRIKRVESRLTKAIQIKGRPAQRMSLADRMANYKVPGVSIAVINDGRVEWARGYGFLDAENQIPVTEHGLFQAASISKPVASAAALYFVEKGLLSLDEDINAKLLSWKVPANKFTEQRKVTLREILSHTAGLTVHGFGGYATGTPVPTLLQVLDGVKPANSEPVRVDILPGSQFRYSGGGYTVMQQLLVDVAKKPFPEIMAETVLRPARMSDSTFEQPLPDARLAQAAVGYDGEGKPVSGRRHVYPEMAAAGLWTTPTDLCRFAVAIMNAYAGRSDTILSQKLAREMLTPVKDAYGLGLGVQGEGEKLEFSHSGGNAGFCCELVGMPGKWKGAAVMTNGDRGGNLSAEIIRGIADEYGWGRKIIERTVATIDDRVYGEYVGKYQVERAFAVFITQKEGRLFGQLGEGGEMYELYPESETTFFDDELGFKVTFERDAKGKVTGLTLGGVGEKFLAKKVGLQKSSLG